VILSNAFKTAKPEIQSHFVGIQKYKIVENSMLL